MLRVSHALLVRLLFSPFFDSDLAFSSCEKRSVPRCVQGVASIVDDEREEGEKKQDFPLARLLNSRAATTRGRESSYKL